MIEQKQVERLAEECFRGTSKFLVEVIIRTNNIITVFIDADDHVSLEDCRHLNRFLEQGLNREQEDFELTVSSAGLDRPLKTLRQYANRIGREIEVVSPSGKKTTGLLVKAGQKGIEIEQTIQISRKEIEKKCVVIPFGEIRTAKEVITFKKSK